MKYSIGNIRPFDIVPGYRSRLIHSETMTIACVDVEQDAILPEHSHPHEQVLNMMDGIFELVPGGETMLPEAGHIVVIPPNVPHSGKAITSCHIVDMFHPVREDFVSGNVAYGKNE